MNFWSNFLKIAKETHIKRTLLKITVIPLFNQLQLLPAAWSGRQLPIAFCIWTDTKVKGVSLNILFWHCLIAIWEYSGVGLVHHNFFLRSSALESWMSNPEDFLWAPFFLSPKQEWLLDQSAKATDWKPIYLSEASLRAFLLFWKSPMKASKGYQRMFSKPLETPGPAHRIMLLGFLDEIRVRHLSWKQGSKHTLHFCKQTSNSLSCTVLSKYYLIIFSPTHTPFFFFYIRVQRPLLLWKNNILNTPQRFKNKTATAGIVLATTHAPTTLITTGQNLAPCASPV